MVTHNMNLPKMVPIEKPIRLQKVTLKRVM